MKALKFDTAKFIADYKQAAEAGLSQPETAEFLGLSTSNMRGRRARLAKRGIHLPKLRGERGTRKRAARIRVARRTAIVPADGLSFSFTVGVQHG